MNTYKSKLKYKTSKLVTLGTILSLSFFGACSDSTSSSDLGSRTTVEGRVDGSSTNKIFFDDTNFKSSAANIEGATVTAATIQADGTYQIISGIEAKTNQQGEFSLEMDSDTDFEKTVLVAKKNNLEWRGRINADASSSGKVIVKPLTTETTAEADVYAEIVARNNSNIAFTSVESAIDSEVAAEISANEQARTTLYNSLRNESEAEASFLIEKNSELTEVEQNNLISAKSEIQAKLESDLYFATTEEARAQAYQTFQESIVEAYIDADVSASSYAKSRAISNSAFLTSELKSNSNLRASVESNLELMTAYAVDAAVKANFEAMSASESSMQQAATAGSTLKASLSGSAKTSNEIKLAFETYNETILSIMEDESAETHESMITVDSLITSELGLKNTLNVALNSSVTVDQKVEAYVQFFNSVETLVADELQASTSSEVQAAAELMILINLSN